MTPLHPPIHAATDNMSSSDSGPVQPTASLALVAAGLFLVTAAYAMARSGPIAGWSVEQWDDVVSIAKPIAFWSGIACIAVPSAWTVTTRRLTRNQRYVIVVATGLAFYCAKVAYSPFGFTFADELVHQHNADLVGSTGDLFGFNSILAITPSYPGLPSLTAAVSSLTGLSSFAAGLVVIGAARVVLCSALFLMVEQLTKSSRAGALAALMYAGAANYVYFLSQFAYESLALPLALMVIVAAERARTATTAAAAQRWTAVGLVLVPVVVVTHHMTSYVLMLVLTAWAVLVTWMRPTRSRRLPLALAPVAVVSVVGWFLFRAASTGEYLLPVLRTAAEQTFRTIRGEASTRGLFSPEDAGPASPLYERAAALASVAVLAVGILLSIRRSAWKQSKEPFAILGFVATGAFLFTFPLRLVPAAWETAQRASEFLFVAVAGILAVTVLRLVRDSRQKRTASALAIAGVCVVVCGGLVSGWSYALRYPAPYRITTTAANIDPQGVSAARTSLDLLGPENRMIAEIADARLLQVYGSQRAFGGVSPNFEAILQTVDLADWQVEILRSERIEFVVVDRRTISANAMSGYFFAVAGTEGDVEYPAIVIDKFESRPWADRIFDSGDIIIYDIRRLWS